MTMTNNTISNMTNRTAEQAVAVEQTHAPVQTQAQITSPVRVNFVNIPQELKDNASFCLWKKEKRNGRPTKVPYNPKTGELAKTNDPSTFSDFSTAMKAYAMGGWDGIGYRVSEGNVPAEAVGASDGIGAIGGNVPTEAIGAIDIDHCIRPDGTLNDVAASILGFFPNTYFERSPSGTGLRGFFKLSPDFAYDRTVYYINNRKYGLEVYLPGATNRFVTVTGDLYRPGSVERNDTALLTTLDTFMKRKSRVSQVSSTLEPCSYLTDEQVIQHALNSASGDKFSALYAGNWQEGYDSQSDADMALVSVLAFWCGNVEEQIDRIFRTSGLMRDKWDRKTGDSTYGQITIRNVVNSSSAIYMPLQGGTGDASKNAEDEFDDLDDPANDSDALDALDNPYDRKRPRRPAFKPDTSFVTLTIERMAPQSNPRYQHGEIGVGNMFADYYKPIARFIADRDVWYVYDGCIWQEDKNSLAVAELAKSLADQLYAFALNIRDEDTRSRYIKRIQKLQLRRNRRTMIEDAKSVYPLRMAAFDDNKYLFNCANGTLDLTTMTFRDHNPKDRITKMSPVYYDPEASCPRWNQFIDEIMERRASVSRYLQKAIGYSLTGDSSLECLFIMYGPTTRNGKTTTIETILKVMGEYGRAAKPDMLATSYFRGQSNAASDDVARLAGARFIGISEMEQKLTINASLTKQLTGGGSITARYLYESPFEFQLQGKIFIDTNHLPNVTDQTLFESGRIKIIPFNRHFEDHEQDKSLKSTLAEPENLSGILNWCIEGYKLFKAEGLDEPEDVKAATAQYKMDSDRISQFMDQCLRKEKGAELKTAAVYARYKDWCVENGYKYEGSQNFYNRISLSYFIEKRRPWKVETTGNMNANFFIDNVTWVTGEEPGMDLVPVE